MNGAAMDCHDCEEQLYAYLDQELSEMDVRTVREHLTHCTGCTDHFYFEERLLRKVHDACAEERAPEHLRRAVVLRLRRT